METDLPGHSSVSCPPPAAVSDVHASPMLPALRPQARPHPTAASLTRFLQVWRPGIDPIGEDEELEYDVTAYDCFHRLQLDWPCLRYVGPVIPLT